MLKLNKEALFSSESATALFALHFTANTKFKFLNVQLKCLIYFNKSASCLHGTCFYECNI